MRFMVIGASGYLGNTVFKKLKDTYENDVYGTCYKMDIQELIKINLKKSEEVKQVLSYKPDVIIWCVCDVEEEMDLTQIGLSEIINNITQKVRLIYISTTVGQGREQTEEVIPYQRKPYEYLSKYVNGKIEGEKIVKSHSNHVIIRPGSIYGNDYDGKIDARMGKLLQISNSGEKCSRTANMYASFVNVNDLADSIVELTISNFTGIINIAGEKAISHFDFYKKLARLMNLDDSFIIPDYKAEDFYHSLNSNKRKNVLNSVIRDI
jgi:dTDP-4-dehydrorhamnose reductase